MSEESEEMPEAFPRSDVDPDVELEVEGGTLVWKDPVVSGRPIPLAYVWPVLILAIVAFVLYAVLIAAL